jgi:type II secretory ATPase GspE/PulE/Tfp pilus assembly ATPase PilB-like protein/transcriptional regulator with GAF, ATPase, and Fis domain
MPTTSSTNNETIQSLNSRIASASDTTSLLPGVISELKNILSCEAITLFLVDRENKQLVSLNHISKKVSQIRVDMSPETPLGYVASYGKALNISDKIPKSELVTYNPGMTVSSSLDKPLKLKTKSMMVIPLPFQQKLVGAVEIVNKQGSQQFTTSDFKISKELAHSLGLLISKIKNENGATPPLAPADPQKKLFQIINAIHSAKNVDEILLEMKLSILELFNASLITIYATDMSKNEIFSKLKSGDAVNEIRVPISPTSVAGFAAMAQKTVVIENVHDSKQLKQYHADLAFDSSWDEKSGFKTKGMLVCPLIHKKRLMGVIQLVNKKGSEKFNTSDQKNAQMISETLALAFFNQTKFVQQKPTKFSYLTNNGIITERELTEAIGKARRSQMDIEAILLHELKVSRKDLGKSLEQFYKVPYLSYDSSVVLPHSVFEGLNLSFLTKNFWVPVEKSGNSVVVLIDNPFNKDKIQNIKLIFPKKNVELKVGLKADIRDYLNSTVTDSDSSNMASVDDMSDLLHALKSEKDDVVTEIESEDNDLNAISEADSTIVKLVNKILIDAYDQGVSDIHVEPGLGKDAMEVRYRIDGTCRIFQEIPPMYKHAVISRLKIMARLDIAERRMPQDGKIKMRYGGKEIEFRLATCPTVGGNEDAVLRILAASKPIPLDDMNFTRRNLELIKKMATKPYGLILAVGPTGSGKTTTLHSALGHINTRDKKIWTAEDPVEITQKGLRQVQMLPKIGLDFARAMRSFLRGDPDVIMVGEMRDVETCSIGLEASLTGHLVFSTLHTNSAPETITRLLDMGMNPLNFADAMLVIIAQRLVRTLCKECKEDYHPSQKEFEILVREYGVEQFKKLGIQYTNDLKLKKPVGCTKCNDTGYRGRTGLHEVLEGTDEMKRKIMGGTLVEELRNQAIKDGMTTLKQDGLLKVFKGDCDLKQVMAVCIV